MKLVTECPREIDYWRKEKNITLGEKISQYIAIIFILVAFVVVAFVVVILTIDTLVGLKFGSVSVT